MTQVAETTRALKALQETEDAPEALAKIPALGLGDLPRTNKPIPSAWEDVAGIPLMTHDLPTGGIVYLDLAFFDDFPLQLHRTVLRAEARSRIQKVPSPSVVGVP